MLRPFKTLLPLLCLALAACGRSGQRGRDVASNSAPIECAPFARALTGVSLAGDGADWWYQAQGRYDRGDAPSVGSILVLRRSGRLPHGHVAVVSRVLSRREILVTQANWVHHRVTQDQPVIDASDAGDWSSVRMYWPPSGQMGTHPYPAFGFIRPDRPATHDRLIAATPAAIRVAEQGW
jgi:hypothetical protein